MKKKLEPTRKKHWRPEYPESKDVRVQMRYCEFETFISDGRPGINVTDYPVEAPACFWIDHEHVYLRTNWSMWGSISQFSPEQVVAICNSHYCRIVYSIDGKIGECSAPVYRIAELPEKLFNYSKNDELNSNNDELNSNNDELNNDSNSDSDDSTDDKSEFQQCVDKIEKIIKGTGLSVFTLCKLGDDCAPVVISDAKHAIIMDILPEDRNFIFSAPDGEKRHKEIGNWPTHIVSLDFIEQLRNMKKSLAELEPDAIIDIGFLANGNTIEALQRYFNMDSEDISDLNLFSYDSLGEKLESLFSVKKETEETIAKQVKEIIVDHLGVDASKVQEDAVFVDDLGVDEFVFIELTVAFGVAFDCVFPDNAFEIIRTVKDAIDFIKNAS